MSKITVRSGNRSVVITSQQGKVWANLYVLKPGARGISVNQKPAEKWEGKSEADAMKWAALHVGSDAKPEMRENSAGQTFWDWIFA